MTSIKTPWHLWVIGCVSLLWNAVGAFDYTMTKTGADWYLAAHAPEQIAFIDAFPAWATASWAIAVWFSVIGSVLLLMRHRLAPVSFAVSLFAIIATTVYSYGLSDINAMDVTGGFGLYFSAVILVTGLFLWLYSRRMRTAGILR